MKSIELEKLLKTLTKQQQEFIEQGVKDHIISALAYFYEVAQVGDNPLDLNKSIPYDDNGTDVYLITGIEMMFYGSDGEMYFHQAVESDPSEVAMNPLSILTLTDLIELLKAYEKEMNCFYEGEFEFKLPR